MLWIFFALAEMPLVVEMVAAYSHPRRTSYTFWAMYVLIQVVHVCVWFYMLNINVHVDALFYQFIVRGTCLCSTSDSLVLLQSGEQQYLIAVLRATHPSHGDHH